MAPENDDGLQRIADASGFVLSDEAYGTLSPTLIHATLTPLPEQLQELAEQRSLGRLSSEDHRSQACDSVRSHPFYSDQWQAAGQLRSQGILDQAQFRALAIEILTQGRTDLLPRLNGLQRLLAAEQFSADDYRTLADTLIAHSRSPLAERLQAAVDLRRHGHLSHARYAVLVRNAIQTATEPVIDRLEAAERLRREDLIAAPDFARLVADILTLGPGAWSERLTAAVRLRQAGTFDRETFTAILEAVLGTGSGRIADRLATAEQFRANGTLSREAFVRTGLTIVGTGKGEWAARIDGLQSLVRDGHLDTAVAAAAAMAVWQAIPGSRPERRQWADRLVAAELLDESDRASLLGSL